jgi:hypothetical protein
MFYVQAEGNSLHVLELDKYFCPNCDDKFGHILFSWILTSLVALAQSQNQDVSSIFWIHAPLSPVGVSSLVLASLGCTQ